MLAIVIAGLLSACGGTPAPSGSTPPILTTAPPDGSGSIGDVPSVIPGISLIADRTTLLLADGKAVSLSKVDGGAIDGYQTRDGWLVRGYGNGSDTLSLWLVKPDGSLLRLVDKADAPVAVGADGRRIAWRSAGKLHAGQINPTSGVSIEKSSTAPVRGHPISLTATTVVLGYSETGGGIDHHDLWYPALGEYKPTWGKSSHVRVVYGPAPDGDSFLGLVPNPAGAGSCLAVLNARDSLKPARTACGLRIQLDRHSALSRDGRWLAVPTTDGSGNSQIGVIDLSTVDTKPEFTTTWSGARGGCWDETNALLAPDESGRLVRFRMGSSLAEVVDRPGLTPGTSIALLPRLI
jgi:hypothetical protein